MDIWLNISDVRVWKKAKKIGNELLAKSSARGADSPMADFVAGCNSVAIGRFFALFRILAFVRCFQVTLLL